MSHLSCRTSAILKYFCPQCMGCLLTLCIQKLTSIVAENRVDPDEMSSSGPLAY